jgi:hypothetical protein
VLPDFILGAVAVAVFVFLVAWLTTLAGATDPARGSWALFGFGGLLALFALAQRNSLLFGAAAGDVVATSIFVWWSVRRNRRRDQDARLEAAGLGLSYQDDAVSDELATRAGALMSGSRNKIQRVLAGRWRGKDVTLFDYNVEIDAPRGGAVERNFTCVLVRVPLAGEPIKITTESFLTAVAAKLGYRDLQVGDPAFDRAFNVQSKDPSAALRMLAPAVRSVLFHRGRGRNFLIGGGAVLCMAPEGTASRTDLLDLVSELGELVAGPPGPDAAPVGRDIAPNTAELVPDRTTSLATRRIAFGLVFAILVPLAFIVGGFLLFYVACVTGNGCL